MFSRTQTVKQEYNSFDNFRIPVGIYHTAAVYGDQCNVEDTIAVRIIQRMTEIYRLFVSESPRVPWIPHFLRRSGRISAFFMTIISSSTDASSDST